MSNNKKNISTVIILICIISVIIGIFLPKKENNFDSIKPNIHKEFNFKRKNIGFTPFKHEKISVIKLEGIISDSGNNSIFKDITSSNQVLDLIKKATYDPTTKGIVIRVNSPGGTVAASQELFQAILKAKKKKPVVITMGDVAASGGYYIAAAADKIFANPGTLTGSIGVITSYLNFYELLNKLGIKGITIKSGLYKDIGNPTRPLTEEERKILQALLDNSYKQFIDDVAKGRQMPKEKVASLAKGLIYTGEQAKKAGLVDFLGDYSKAVKYTQKLAKERFPELAKKYGKTDLPVEESWKNSSIIDVLLSATTNFTDSARIENKLLKTYSYSKYQPLWLLE